MRKKTKLNVVSGSNEESLSIVNEEEKKRKKVILVLGSEDKL